MEDQLERLISSESLPDVAGDDERALHGFLMACRGTAEAIGDDARVVERSISASTRQDLSWRGDLRDTARFVRDRLRSSGLMRLAAASLLLHLAALPVVGLYMLTEEPDLPRFFVEPGRPDSPFESAASAEPDGELEIIEPELRDELLVQNSLRWGRYQLGVSRLRLQEGAVLLPAWLAPRHEVLYGSVGVIPESATLSLPGPVLALELSLDELLVTGRSGAVTTDMSTALDVLAGLLDLSSEDAAWLIASALARAESYGLSTPKSAEALRRARSGLPRGDARRALIEIHGDVRAILPLDITWLEAVRAYQPTCLADPTLESIRSWAELTPR